MDPTFRPGTLDDLDAAYEVFTRTTADLERRTGTPDAENDWLDPAFVAAFWRRRRPLFEHLTVHANGFWVAERRGRIVGYARASCQDGVRELNEFFVLPEHQNGGIGRDLLARAFPTGGARRRAVIGTTDVRALARYLKAGVYPRFPIYALSGTPRPIEIATDLAAAAAGTEAIDALREIDRAVLGFARDADHAFLLRERPVRLFRRAGRVVGYGYFGRGTGPIALLDPADFPAVLARGEAEAAARGEEEFGMNVPLVNRDAVDHLLGRGFRLEDFTVLFLSDEAFGRFEHYIVSTPDFFV
ncbi:MAG: hypothetical protein AVDCRST_MAG49-916 [uncultured Thermomicrobiales bacterium]|uniref:N-acetyltransferase domain-containing protein n=1 Tax=uncultured Thermomicrobiales bacterium TaxID=1645740 RepID=A0A6J4U651_9BACT|nr:MAG: hypothetical protein AVDCRST_MAG49-916 [uncultured Thermomicrobiales bacterium]